MINTNLRWSYFPKLQKEFEDNISVDRTKFMSVEINVLDENPDTAALIANDIASLLDTVSNRMIKVIANEALNIVQDEFNNEKNYINVLEDSSKFYRRKGIIDIQAQTERYTEQLAKAMLEGKSNAMNILQSRLDTLGKYAGDYANLRDQLHTEKIRLGVIRTKLREAKVDAERSLQHKFIVNNAFPAEKKTYPIRWLIVAISTVATFLITLILLLIVESIKAVKTKL